MKVFVVSHDRGVDGGSAVAVFATVDGAVLYIEQEKAVRYPNLKRRGESMRESGLEPLSLVWDSLGDTFFIDEFEVQVPLMLSDS